MTDNFYFRIHKPENNILLTILEIIMLEPIIIDADSISDFYSDSHINLSWNPIAKQVTFTLQQQHTVQGGYTIFNSRKNSTKIFQYNAVPGNDYYFASSGIQNSSYSFNVNWNRSTLWISSVFDETFSM